MDENAQRKINLMKDTIHEIDINIEDLIKKISTLKDLKRKVQVELNQFIWDNLTSKEKILELANKFEKASYGDDSIDSDKDLQILDIYKIPKSFNSKKYGKIDPNRGWESFCCFVYEKVSGEPHPGSKCIGTGFRSKIYGREVANLLRTRLKGESNGS